MNSSRTFAFCCSVKRFIDTKLFTFTSPMTTHQPSSRFCTVQQTNYILVTWSKWETNQTEPLSHFEMRKKKEKLWLSTNNSLYLGNGTRQISAKCCLQQMPLFCCKVLPQSVIIVSTAWYVAQTVIQTSYLRLSNFHTPFLVTQPILGLQHCQLCDLSVTNSSLRPI